MSDPFNNNNVPFNRYMINNMKHNYDNYIHTITISNEKMGIMNKNPTETLDVIGNSMVDGNIYISSNCIAGSFMGDGSLVTHLDKDNFEIDTIFDVSLGGTGLSNIPMNKILIGNDTNSVMTSSDLHWDLQNSRLGVGTSNPSELFEVGGNGKINGNLNVSGSLSKGSGTFNIPHPLPSKTDTHRLVHSFIEGPLADLIYSGMVTLEKGKAQINIDDEAKMTAGTFEVLTTNCRRSTTNETGFSKTISSLNGPILTITSENPDCEDTIYWQIVAERNDPEIKRSNITDDNGRLIVEPVIKVN